MKLKLLNEDSLSMLKGGEGAEPQGTCSSGNNDTIICAIGIGDMRLCLTAECTCPKGFTSDCKLLGGVDITCPKTFNIVIKPS